MSATIHYLPIREPAPGVALADKLALYRVAELARGESAGATDGKVTLAVHWLAIACDAWAEGRQFDMCDALDEFARNWMGRAR